MAGIKNKYDFYKGFLEAIGAEGINETDYKNEEELRKKILDTLDVEYVFDDVNQTDLFREKFLAGISSGGGGGSSDFSTAEVTITSEAERWECGLNVPAIISDTLNIYNEIYENTTLNVVLYKGSCIGVIYSETMVVGVSGNATLDGEYITITGNCIITLSQK